MRALRAASSFEFHWKTDTQMSEIVFPKVEKQVKNILCIVFFLFYSVKPSSRLQFINKNLLKVNILL